MNHELYRLVGLKIRFIKIKELYVKIYLCSLLFHRCYNREGYHDVDHDSVDNSFDFDYNCDYYNSFFISFCFDDLKLFYSSGKNLEKSFLYSFSHDWIGNGLLTR